MSDPSYIIGTWRSVAHDGEMDKFFTERGIPFPIRKILTLMADHGEVIFEIKNNELVETEVGTFKNTVKEGRPLDGTKVPFVAPDGVKGMTYYEFSDGMIKIIEVVTEDDQVIHEFKQEGDKVIRKISNSKSGTFFTITLARK